MRSLRPLLGLHLFFNRVRSRCLEDSILGKLDLLDDLLGGQQSHLARVSPVRLLFDVHEASGQLHSLTKEADHLNEKKWLMSNRLLEGAVTKGRVG